MEQSANGSQLDPGEAPEAPASAETLEAEKTPKQKRADLMEATKLLALEHGIPKAAKIMGLKLYTVKSWAKRKAWNIPYQNAPKLHPAHPINVQPAEILRTQLLNNKSRSSLALSSYLAKTSETLAEAPNALTLTRRAVDLGDLYGKLYPAESQPNQILNIAIVTGQRTILPAD